MEGLENSVLALEALEVREEAWWYFSGMVPS